MPKIPKKSVTGGYVYWPTSVFISKNIRTLERVITFIWLGHDRDIDNLLATIGDRGDTVVKVLCYKSEGCWFDPGWCNWNFFIDRILLIAQWPCGRLSL